MSAPWLQQDLELAVRTGGLFFNGKRITRIESVAWTEPGASNCRRIFARKAGAFWGAWLDDPRCDDEQPSAATRPGAREHRDVADDALCGGAS